MASTTLTLDQLAFQITGLTYNISKYFKDNNLQTPSYSVDGPSAFPTSAPVDIQAAREKLLELTTSLHDLVLGPEERVRRHAAEYTNPASLRWIQHFKIATHVPQEGNISYHHLAKAAAVPEHQLKRIIRYVMLNGYFSEPEPGHVAHSAMSLLLATSPHIQDYVNHCVEFSYPVSVKMTEMTEKYHGSGAKNETAFNVAFDTQLPMFAWLKGEKEHSERFGRLMGAMKSAPVYSVQHLVNGYDWASVGKGKVVDVGGSLGHTTYAIAEKYPEISFVVQDLLEVISQGQSKLPDELKDRVEFISHDFFKEQPVEDAEIYLLRQILHDWPDDEATAILKALVASMKRGSKILVMDQVVPPPGLIPNAQEKAARTVDLVVMSHFDGKQRDMDDWKKIFTAADERLVIKNVSVQPGSVLSVVELTLEDKPMTNGHATIGEHIQTTNGVQDEQQTNEYHEPEHVSAVSKDSALSEPSPSSDKFDKVMGHTIIEAASGKAEPAVVAREVVEL